MLGSKGLIEGIVRPSAALLKVVYSEFIFQLTHFRLHLLRVRFTLVMRQGFLSQDELVQLVRNVEITTVLL